jgi:hypothetical protein
VTKKLSIVFVSTWLQKCGIATYTWDLAQALKERGHAISVLTEILPFDTRSEYTEIPNYPVWFRHGPSRALIDCIQSSRTKPDYVCIQHEYGLFPNTEDLFRTIKILTGLGIKSVTTLHTVKPGYQYLDFGSMVVHTPEAAFFTGPNTRIIPHGVTIRFPTTEEKAEAKKKLGVDAWKKVFLAPGFVSTSKDIHNTVGTFLASTSMDSILIVSGECRDDLLANDLTTNLTVRGHTSRVKLDLTFADDNKRDLYFKAADVIILGREKDSPYSASGQIATALGYGLPILARECPIHRDGGVVLYRAGGAGESNELERFIKNTDTPALEYLSTRAKKLALERSWNLVAQEYEGIFLES